MQNLSEQINRVELKVRKLALKVEQLQNENQSLTSENNQLRNSITDYNKRVADLEEQLQYKQQVSTNKREQDPGSSKKLRKDIEQYIKEIDKCIEWLQNT